MVSCGVCVWCMIAWCTVMWYDVVVQCGVIQDAWCGVVCVVWCGLGVVCGVWCVGTICSVDWFSVLWLWHHVRGGVVQVGAVYGVW